MRRFGIACMFGLVAVGGAMGRAAAADPPAVGIVNLDKLFKTHKPFQDKLTPLKDEAKELDKKLQVRQAEFDKVVADLGKAAPGSPEFSRLQQTAQKLNTDLQRFIATERGNLQTKEASLYVTFYKQVDAEIAKLAKAKGLKLVIRDQDASFDEKQQVNDLLKTLNRTVLYQDGLDITDDLLKALGSAPTGKSK